MIGKNIEEIKEEDLQDLVDNKVSEKKTLEYKLLLRVKDPEEKREFLADVSSFANASGGDIIYGIREDNEIGEPVELVDLKIENLGKTIEQLENIIRDGISPRISTVEIKPIELSKKGVAIIIRIKKSWNSPHRVVFRGHDKFYSRNSKGKYPLDVGELRTAFTLSETITERIRNFRLDRISKINADETPIILRKRPKVVLHILPLVSFSTLQNYDVYNFDHDSLRQIYSHSNNERYNLEGYLTYFEIDNGKYTSYVQIYRNGIIEGVDASLISSSVLEIDIIYEDCLVKFSRNYLDILKKLGILPPIFVFLTMIDVKGCTIRWGIPNYSGRVENIDRDVLILPEGIVESYEDKTEYVLKNTFNSVWNACGHSRSYNYNEDGKWEPNKSYGY